jgi:hypothetical protein
LVIGDATPHGETPCVLKGFALMEVLDELRRATFQYLFDQCRPERDTSFQRQLGVALR